MRTTRWRGLDPWRTLVLLSGLSALAFVVVIANSETRLLQNLDLWAAAASLLAAVAASGVRQPSDRPGPGFAGRARAELASAYLCARIMPTCSRRSWKNLRGVQQDGHAHSAR